MNLKFSYWYFTNALSKDFCNRLIDKNKNHKEKRLGVIGSIPKVNKKNIKTLKKTRNSKILFLDDQEVFDKLHPYVDTANKNSGWKFNWDSSEYPQFTEYKKNNHYSWHQDSLSEPYDDVSNPIRYGKIRKLSMTCSLTDPSKYEGGELQFFLPDPTLKNQGQIISCKEILPQGSIVVFPSFIWHRVTPVTKGVRHSLVMWSLGKPYV